MNVLITGGAGFIGSHVLDLHVAKGDHVFVIDNCTTGKETNIEAYLNHPQVTFYKADLLEFEGLEAVLSLCEVVYHLAASVGMFYVIQHPVKTLDVNVGLTQKILLAANRVDNKPLIVIASSSEVYGSSDKAMKETDALVIDSAAKAHASYPISKLCDEAYALAHFKEHGTPVIVVRFFNTVGDKQSARYGMVLPRFVKQALSNEPLTIFGGGQQTRSFCDVHDVCEMLYRLIQTPAAIGEIVNVGSDEETTILNLAHAVIQLTHSSSSLLYKELDEVYGDEYLNIEHRRPDLTKLKQLIAYERALSLKETILSIATRIAIK